MTGENKFLIGIGIITAILLIAGVFFFSKNQPPPENSNQTIDQNTVLANATHTIGDQNAPLNVVEFGDFQCPACAQAEPILKKVLGQNDEKIYFVFRHYPLSTHKNARIAAQAAEAASIQDKFWEMHDLIYENQKEWSDSGDAEEIFFRYAEQIGLDKSKFKDDIDKTTTTINDDYALGNKVGVKSTPTFFINGKKYSGVVSEATFQQLLDSAN